MSIEEEKKTESFSENVVAVSNNDDDFRLLTAEAREEGERALVRKLDRRLMPTAVVIYILNYIDVCQHPFMNSSMLMCIMHSVSLLLLRGCKV